MQKPVLEKLSLKFNNPVEVYLLRIDQIHPHISDNKWYKLKYNLTEAKDSGYDTLLTFGGAYSNHIYATAAAGKKYGFKTIGIIRGEEHLPLNPTLQFASDNGMKLIYRDRSTFRSFHNRENLDRIKEEFGNVYVLPEGSTNKLAVKGCSEIPQLINMEYDYICSPCGTGGTIAGLIAGSKPGTKVLGFSVLKGGSFLQNDVQQLLLKSSVKQFDNWTISLDYHFGGYAKITKELVQFIIDFELTHNIPLDYIYTGKMMYGIFDLIRKSYFKKGSRIVAVHTGGLQGNAGMRPRIEKFLASKT